LAIRDRPKFGLGLGAEDNNLNCFSEFRFQPNIDLTFCKGSILAEEVAWFRQSAEVHKAVSETATYFTTDQHLRPKWSTGTSGRINYCLRDIFAVENCYFSLRGAM